MPILELSAIWSTPSVQCSRSTQTLDLMHESESGVTVYGRGRKSAPDPGTENLDRPLL